MKISFKLTILIFFLLNNYLFSQTPPYYHYTSIDGLASSTVYDILQDRNGYIWFATSNGVSRYDGHRYKNSGIKEGLNSNMITAILEGSEGEIYIANYEKGINVLKDGNIKTYTKPGEKIIRVNYIFLEENKLYGYGSGGLNLFTEDKTENVIKYNFSTDPTNKPIIFNKILKLSDGRYLVSTTNGFYRFENKEFIKINIEGFKDTEVLSLYEDKDRNIFASTAGKIYQIKNYNIVKVFIADYPGDKINNIMSDRRGNVWFSVFNRGFYMIPAGSDIIYDVGVKLKLQKTVVSHFFEDNEGNIWVSTLGKGVYCLHNFYLNNYGEEDGLSNNDVHVIEQDKKGTMLIGTLNGINILKDGKFEMLKTGTKTNITDFIYDMKSVNDKVYVCSSFSDYNVINRFYKNREFVLFTGASFCMTKDSNYLVGQWQNLIYSNKKIGNTLNQGQIIKVFEGDIVNNRINKMYEDSESNLWIGTTLGLCKMKNGTKKFFSDNEILNSSVKSIIEDNQNRIWFAGEKGIASYNLKDSSVSGFKNISGYDISSSTSLAVDKDNRIWAGNMKGVYILENDSIKYINTGQGLPSDEVISLYYNAESNIMWIGTSSGFSCFDINMFDSYKTPPLNIAVDYLKAGDSTYTKYEGLKFDPENNDIHIGYSVFCFSSPLNIKYQYRINIEWLNTDNDFLDFSSLKAGSYNIYFRGKRENGEWSNPSYVGFVIKPKFTETIWFQLMMAASLVCIILIAAKYRINYSRKKSTEKIENTKKMFELKHQALSAMMNPHFVFNSLNSVQYLVNQGRKDEANDYISILAKLIRKNLDIASNSFILLEEEINRLTLYLEIEKLRFQDKFTYEINAGEDVDAESVMIPNMILQPFVENAVWYGIMNSGKKGFVKISFEYEDVIIESNSHKCLVIKITDNGIGLKKSGEKKKEGHISKGIKIIEERLQLLSQELELPQPVIIEDMSLRNENSTGTEVIITLPNTLYKNISEEEN